MGIFSRSAPLKAVVAKPIKVTKVPTERAQIKRIPNPDMRADMTVALRAFKAGKRTYSEILDELVAIIRAHEKKAQNDQKEAHRQAGLSKQRARTEA